MSARQSRTLDTALVLAGAEWLDRDAGWYWFPSKPRIALRTLIIRVVSVARELPVGELRRAVSRPHRQKGLTPPRDILLKFCERIESVEVIGTTIRARPSLNWESVIPGQERKLVRLFGHFGDIANRDQIEDLIEEYDIGESYLETALSYSPVIDRLAAGVFGLIGADSPPGLVAQLQPRRKGRILLDHGWTHRGQIWLLYSPSRTISRIGILPLPSGVSKLVQGELQLARSDCEESDVLKVKGNSAWGLPRDLIRAACCPGLALLLTLSPSAKRAAIRVLSETDFRPPH